MDEPGVSGNTHVVPLKHKFFNMAAHSHRCDFLDSLQHLVGFYWILSCMWLVVQKNWRLSHFLHILIVGIETNKGMEEKIIK